MPPHAELLLRNARIVDGSGAPSRTGDVAVSGGKITAVGPKLSVPADAELELGGLALAPGFIDIHTHTDYIQLVEPRSLSKLFDGVTTEVSGNCGFSAFPLSEEARAREAARWEPQGVAVDWTDFAGYRRRQENFGTGINRAFFVGHGFLRGFVVGHANRSPTGPEMERMKAILAREIEAGAIGLSTGLIYPPGCFAERAEIAELCTVVAERGGLYASHIRGEGATLLEAIEEALWICRKSGARTQISHLKASRPQNWHKLDSAFAMIEAARAEGLPVLSDRYPYDATSTGLDQLLPEWAYDGGLEAELARLRDPAALARIRDEMARKYDDDYYGRVLIAWAQDHPELEGKYLTDLAARAGVDPATMAVEILLQTRGACECVFFVLSDENMKRVLAHDYVMVASDAEARATEGPASSGKPHPRAYGTFSRALGRLSRDEGLFTLEEAVRRVTSLPAGQLGFSDRGRIAPGFAADLVVFDPAAVRDHATYLDPHRYSAGFRHIMVNGRLVVRDGCVTDQLPGRILGLGHDPAADPARPRPTER
ncbi:MAG: D-aminoacylase [Candidatus Wallbacteria bacterium]|nr:D-aminoacylase [Candidatus Wallbacteria bacterium]